MSVYSTLSTTWKGILFFVHFSMLPTKLQSNIYIFKKNKFYICYEKIRFSNN